MLRRVRAASPTASCALAVLALAAGACAQATVDYSGAAFPGDERPGWVTSRVVDDLSGAPIAGADVYFVRESETPLGGSFWFTRRVVTDDDGWLRAQVDDIEGRWHIQVLRHPDYGVAARVGLGDSIWRVGRPFDVPVRIVDWRGAPVAGAKIGFCGGCGHTPDLANATTGPDGVAVLQQIDPHSDIGDVYVQHAGLGLGYESVRWCPGEGPELVTCRWSPAMSGVVLDHLGGPVAGAFVAALDVHRGPWAATASDGSFTLLGARPELGPSHVRLASGREVWFDTATRFPVTLHLPDPASPEPTDGRVEQPDAAARDVRTRSLRVALSGAAGLQAVADWPGAPQRRARGAEEVEIPRVGPFVISVTATGGPSGRPSARDHYFADASALPPEPVPLAYFDACEVKGRVVDAQGQPVPARVAVRETWTESARSASASGAASQSFSLLTHKTGRALLEITPEDPRLAPRLAWITLPQRDAARRLELGDVALRAGPQLVVAAVDGRPLPGAEVSWARAGHQEAGSMRDFAVGEDGVWMGPDLMAGDALLVRADEDAVPLRTVLEGPGPWVVKVPAGALALELVDEHGAPTRAWCVLGDHEDLLEPGAVLKGLPPGEHTLYLSAAGYQTAVVRVTVGTQQTALRVVMKRA